MARLKTPLIEQEERMKDVRFLDLPQDDQDSEEDFVDAVKFVKDPGKKRSDEK
jgi:hypothetical protein